MAGDAVWLEVLPSMAAFAGKLTEGATKEAQKAGAASNVAFGKAFAQGDGGQTAVVDKLRKTSQAAEKAVASETQAIAKARAAQREAAAKVIEAEDRLAKARESGDGAKIAAAEERLAAARERAEGAAAGVVSAEKRLAAASSARKDAVEDLTTAEKKLADETADSTTETGKASTAMGRFKDRLKDGGGEAKGMAGKLGGLVAGLAGVAGAADLARAGVANAFEEAAAGKVLKSQMGLSPEESKRAGQIAGALYADGYGESVSDMSGAVGAVLSSVQGMREASVDEVTKMTGQIKTLADVFGMDVARVSQVTGQMMTTGLAKDAQHGVDLLTATLQKVPANVREEILDATDEYGPFFAQLGISGETAMTMLADASAKGMYGIDKTGDALKELTISLGSLGDDKGAQEALASLGLDWRQIQADFLAGGDTAEQAFAKVVGGLEGMQDPAAQSKAALALFKTPLEDLNTGEIPAFIDQLANMDGGLGDVSGKAQMLTEDMASTVSPIDQLKRSLESTASDGLEPFIQPAQDMATWAKENPGLVQGVVVILGALAGALTIASIAQWAMNSAMLANPVTWVILGIGALIGALVLLVTNWDKVVAFLKNTFGPMLSNVQGWFGDVGRKAGELWQGLKDGAGAMGRVVGDAFNSLKDKAMTPVRWIGNNVINPLLSGIEKVAGFFGIKWNLPRLNFASGGSYDGAKGGSRGANLAFADGGIMPGYTPGRDVHRFWSPTGGSLELSGGEPILRPEVGSVLGSSWVHGINQAARTGGQGGVREFLHEQGFARGGFYQHPNAERYATGGIRPNATQGFNNYNPTFLAAIKAWAAATGRWWSMTGNGGARTFAQQKRAWDLYQSGRGPLAANPWKGGPHMVPGRAMDLSPRPGEIPSAAALLPRFGLGLTVRGEPWHVGWRGGALGGGSTGGGGFDVGNIVSSMIGKMARLTGAGQLGELLNAIPGKVIDGAVKSIRGKLGFDSGGWLEPGLTVAVNKTGQPEAVLTNPQWADISRLVASVERAGSLDDRTPEEIREALEGMRMRVDLDNGEVWFENEYDRRQAADQRRQRAHSG